jgi:hypothetical protein
MSYDPIGATKTSRPPANSDADQFNRPRNNNITLTSSPKYGGHTSMPEVGNTQQVKKSRGQLRYSSFL